MPCFVTSTDQGCRSVSFRFTLVFCNEHYPWFLVCFILFQSFPYISYSSFVTKQKWAYKKKFERLRTVSVPLFYFVMPCFVMSTDQGCRSVSFVSFVTQQKWVYIKKKVSVSSFHFVSPCFVTSTDQGFWSVSSCFRIFPIYHIHFICYETEMGLQKKKYLFHRFISFLPVL